MFRLEPGWRSGYRASLEIKQKRAKARNGKIAGGLRARRGSNPFPGANKSILIRQHATTLTPTPSNIAAMLTMWHDPSPHTQTAIQKQPNPKKQPFPNPQV